MTEEDGYHYAIPAARTQPKTPPTIVVQALKENLRPVGFAPWPEKPKRQPKSKP